MRKILLLVHDDAGLGSRLQAALDVTRALDGHLVCLDITIPIVAVGVDPLFGTMVLEPATNSKAVAAARNRVAATGLSFDWIERRGELCAELAHVAPLVDLVILSSDKDLLFPAMHHAIGDVLLKAKKAVLAVPCGAPGMSLAGEAFLLWDGSREADSAVLTAMPLLRHARSVTILEIDDGSLKLSAIKAADYLWERGVTNHIVHEMAFGEKAGLVILEKIKALKPAYVVMGGFGHSRLLEGVFGGVTERLLNDCPVPLFISH